MAEIIKSYIRMVRPHEPGRQDQCAFCCRESEEVKRLLAGPRHGICGDCIKAAKRYLSGEDPAVA